MQAVVGYFIKPASRDVSVNAKQKQRSTNAIVTVSERPLAGGKQQTVLR